MAEKQESCHKCVLCDSILESKESLQDHFRKHANGEITSKSSAPRVRNQKRIIKKGSSEERKLKTEGIACDVCGLEFSDNTKAIQHKYKKHPDVTVKYLCPYCGMQFTIKSLFDKHIDTHSSDSRRKSSILCNECGAEFYFESALNYHLQQTHVRVKTLLQPVPTPPPSKKIKVNVAGEVQSVYYCHVCGNEYVVKFNLQKHLEKQHTEEERCTVPTNLIRCTMCDALFYNQKAYECHNINHKADDLYVSSEEQRLQSISRIDQDFDVRRVPFFNETSRPLTRSKKVAFYNSKVKEEKLSPPPSPDSSDNEEECKGRVKLEIIPLQTSEDDFKT